MMSRGNEIGVSASVEDRAASGDPEMTAYAVLGFVRAEAAEPGTHVQVAGADAQIVALPLRSGA